MNTRDRGKIGHLEQLTASDLLEGCFSSTRCSLLVYCTGSRSHTFYYTSTKMGHRDGGKAAQMGTQKVTGTLLAAGWLEVGFINNNLFIVLHSCTWIHQVRLSQEPLEPCSSR